MRKCRNIVYTCTKRIPSVRSVKRDSRERKNVLFVLKTAGVLFADDRRWTFDAADDERRAFIYRHPLFGFA